MRYTRLVIMVDCERLRMDMDAGVIVILHQPLLVLPALLQFLRHHANGVSGIRIGIEAHLVRILRVKPHDEIFPIFLFFVRHPIPSLFSEHISLRPRPRPRPQQLFTLSWSHFHTPYASIVATRTRTLPGRGWASFHILSTHAPVL